MDSSWRHSCNDLLSPAPSRLVRSISWHVVQVPLGTGSRAWRDSTVTARLVRQRGPYSSTSQEEGRMSASGDVAQDPWSARALAPVWRSFRRSRRCTKPSDSPLRTAMRRWVAQQDGHGLSGHRHLLRPHRHLRRPGEKPSSRGETLNEYHLDLADDYGFPASVPPLAALVRRTAHDGRDVFARWSYGAAEPDHRLHRLAGVDLRAGCSSDWSPATSAARSTQ